MTLPALSKQAASKLTERIRKAGADFGALLLEAHDGGAWSVLGYATWGDYVRGEFEFSRQRSYQLLAQGRVNQRLAEAGSELRVTEIEARSVTTRVDTGAIEQQVYERRAGPIPKPASKHHRGIPSLEGKLLRLREESREIVETCEGDALRFMDTRDLERTAETMVTLWSELSERIGAAKTEPREAAESW